MRLKPCPFCGNAPDPERESTFRYTDGFKWGAVACCCTGPEVRTTRRGDSPDSWHADAAKAWNERAGDGASSEEDMLP